MSKKILVVDDEADVRKYLCSLLEDAGFTTISAQNGKEGMELAEKELPDLVTLDITMPEETGVRMLRNIQNGAQTAAIPVVIVSGVDPQFEDFIKGRKQVKPPNAYFEKPIDRDVFIREIRKILEGV